MKHQNKPWHRSKNETIQAFKDFTIFKNLPAKDRNYKNAATEIGKSYNAVSQMGSKHNWIARAEAWDEHIIEEEDKAFALECRKIVRRHAATAKKMNLLVIERLKDTDPMEIPVKDIPKFLDSAVKVERLSHDMATDRVAEGGQDARSEDFDFSNLSGEDLDAMEQIWERASTRGDDTEEDS